MAPRRATTERHHDAAESFFEELAARDHEPLLYDAKGTLRIDIEEDGYTDHHYVRMENSSLKLSKKSGEADAVMRLDRALFNRLAEGRANATAELLRGTLAVGGDIGIITAFQRLFPGPPASRRAYSKRRRNEVS